MADRKVNRPSGLQTAKVVAFMFQNQQDMKTRRFAVVDDVLKLLTERMGFRVTAGCLKDALEATGIKLDMGKAGEAGRTNGRNHARLCRLEHIVDGLLALLPPEQRAKIEPPKHQTDLFSEDDEPKQ